jgi:phosphotransferase system HPr (HPr) family protein
MYSQKVMIDNPTGLHARPAAIFVQKANKFKSDIKIQKNDKIVSAKSIISILALEATKGSEIIIQAEGSDEEEAVKSLVNLLSDTSLE